jgi:hypothetical protein
MKGDTVLSANVTIKAPVKNVCDVSQLRDWKGGVAMVGQERVEIVAVEMEVAE